MPAAILFSKSEPEPAEVGDPDYAPCEATPAPGLVYSGDM